MAMESGPRSEADDRIPAARLVLLIGAGLHAESQACHALVRDGWRCLWLCGLGHALETARLARIDAVVLDSAEIDGEAGSMLARLRRQLGCPIVVVAHQADEIDEILALELGADTFLVRPLAPRRLRAHLTVLMRRTQRAGAEPPPAWAAPEGDESLGGWALDTWNGSLTGRGRRVELTAVQIALMRCLVAAAGRVVTHSQLTAALPGGTELAAHSVYVYISRLRKRLLDEGVHELRVDAVRGRGFALRAAMPGPAS